MKTEIEKLRDQIASVSAAAYDQELASMIGFLRSMNSNESLQAYTLVLLSRKGKALTNEATAIMIGTGDPEQAFLLRTQSFGCMMAIQRATEEWAKFDREGSGEA